MGTELTDPHKIDLWETMLSHRVRDKTKPKWQKPCWAIRAASALPELFQIQVNVGTVSSSKAAELCLEEQFEALRKFFQKFFWFSPLFDVQTGTISVWYWISLHKNGSAHS